MWLSGTSIKSLCILWCFYLPEIGHLVLEHYVEVEGSPAVAEDRIHHELEEELEYDGIGCLGLLLVLAFHGPSPVGPELGFFGHVQERQYEL